MKLSPVFSGKRTCYSLKVWTKTKSHSRDAESYKDRVERVKIVWWHNTCTLRCEFSLDRSSPTAHNQKILRWKKPDASRKSKPRQFDPNITICVSNSPLPHAKRDTFTTLFLVFALCGFSLDANKQSTHNDRLT